jgi:hypothetical protein
MNFGISNILCDYTKYRMSFLEKEVCNYIPDIRKLGIADITEDEFYKLIGLTRQEINQIKNPSSNEVNVQDDDVDEEKSQAEDVNDELLVEELGSDEAVEEDSDDDEDEDEDVPHHTNGKGVLYPKGTKETICLFYARKFREANFQSQYFAQSQIVCYS